MHSPTPQQAGDGAQGPSSSLFYGRTMLAPMVRICSIGFRAMCAANGADVVFTEEVVAAKLRTCRRERRCYPPKEAGGAEEEIVEFVTYDAYKKAFKRDVVLALHAKGRAHSGGGGAAVPVVLQLGACDGATAADAAAMCVADVDGIDINMGCPKKFSIDNGFGAALMTRTATAGAVLRCVHERVNGEAALQQRRGRAVPISFKTRLLDAESAAATVAMLREICTAAGHTAAAPVVHAITLHARVREQRSEQAPLLSLAAEVVRLCRSDALLGGICFVLNGSVRCRGDGEALCQRYGFDGTMIARAALWDPAAVFKRSHPLLTTADAAAAAQVPALADGRDEAHYMASMKAALLHAVRYRTYFQNFKYHLTRAFPEVACLKHRMASVQRDLRSYEDCMAFFGLTEEERAACRAWLHDIELVDAIPAAAADASGDGAAEAITPASPGSSADSTPPSSTLSAEAGRMPKYQRMEAA